MDVKTLAIPLAFVILAAVAVYIVAALPTDWKRKLPIVVAVPLFMIAVWSAIASYRGWPTADRMPDQLQLLWSDVHEPNPKSGDPGSIFIWGIPIVEEHAGPGMFEYKYERGEPRAYGMPYSRKLHEMLEQAKQGLSKGNPVMLKRKPKEEGVPAPEAGDHSETEDEFEPQNMPPLGVPQKDL